MTFLTIYINRIKRLSRTIKACFTIKRLIKFAFLFIILSFKIRCWYFSIIKISLKMSKSKMLFTNKSQTQFYVQCISCALLILHQNQKNDSILNLKILNLTNLIIQPRYNLFVSRFKTLNVNSKVERKPRFWSFIYK